MIVAMVSLKLPPDADLARMTEIFKSSAPLYQNMPGLVRKYYLFDPETRAGGGCYLWESRAVAEKVYTEEWKQTIARRYGAPPTITYFEAPVIVDNDKGETSVAA